MSSFTFSIVTVSLNQGEFIRDNIESVLAQNYPHFEHIIVDGGSTDETLSILAEYPHLKWTSEPDRNQSHGLNKGFKRATGDAIVWLNSDDFLAPDIFPELAEYLTHQRFIITPVGMTDRSGNLLEIVRNCERDYFDLLKYWVPYAWLAQTGVFFRRDLLEEVRLPSGDFLDESLNFCMDFDLWMRMIQRSPLTSPTEKVFAYFRMYGENKTDKDGEATQRECTRVYRRQLSLLRPSERHISVVIPISELNIEDLQSTLGSIVTQTCLDIEVLIVTGSQTQDLHTLKEGIKQIDGSLNEVDFRFLTSQTNSVLKQFNFAFPHASGDFVIGILPGDTFFEDAMLQLHNYFSLSGAGLALFMDSKSELYTQRFKDRNTSMLSFQDILGAELVAPRFAVSKGALQEVESFTFSTSPALGCPSWFSQIAFRSWAVRFFPKVISNQSKSFEVETERFLLFHYYIVSEIISLIDITYLNSRFTQFLIEKEIGIGISKDSVLSARNVLDRAPTNWHTFDYLETEEGLTSIVQQYPMFEPPLKFLAALRSKQGNIAEANELLARYEQIHLR